MHPTVRRSRIYRYAVAGFLLAVPLLAPPTYAADNGPADCAALSNIERQKTYDANDRNIRECIQRGWDPPVKWRANGGKNKGIRVTGSGGFSMGVRQAPEKPPGVMGAKPSVSNATIQATLGFPPWRGFPCQLPGGIDICGGGSSGGGSGPGGSPSCAIASDSSGAFGAFQPINGSMNIPLPCGGAVPLSFYQLSLNASPIGVFATEEGSSQYWAYKSQGGQFEQISENGASLPTTLCGDGNPPLPPAIAQIITYNANSSSIAVRLQHDPIDPFLPADPEATPEKYLIIPISNGVPQVPSGCAGDGIYKPLTEVKDAIIIESKTTPGCEGTPEICAGFPTTPTPGSSCTVVTMYPNATGCTGKVQFAVLDRPNMIYPAGSSISTTAIQGRTGVLTSAGAGSRLYAQYNTIVYFGASGQSFLLPSGGTLKLDNNNRLIMKGPATVNAASGGVLLTAGGTVESSGGALLQTLPAGSVYSPAAALPYAVRLGSNVELPAGYMVPTQPAPYVRLPKDAAQ